MGGEQWGRGLKQSQGSEKSLESLSANAHAVQPSVSAGWQLLKRGFYLPTGRLGDRSPNLPDDYIANNGFKVLQKDTPELLEMHTHLKGTEEVFTIVKFVFCFLFFVFSKCSKKRKSGVYCQVLAGTNSKLF